VFSTQVICDLAELFESGFEVFDDLLGENIGIGEIVGFFEAFVSEPEDVEAGFVTAGLNTLKIRTSPFLRQPVSRRLGVAVMLSGMCPG
jgi:hypothetical protein